jgi:energy-coupling factor transporter transmembrane protein EcfT
MYRVSMHMAPAEQVRAESRLSFDPRATIVAFSAVILACIAPGVSAAGLWTITLFAVGVMLSAGANTMTIVTQGRRILPFVLIVVVFNAIVVRGTALFSIGGIAVLSYEGFQSGVYFASRLIAMYISLAALLFTTPPEKFARGIFGLLKPLSPAIAQSAAFYGFMSMSFVPVFAREFERIRIAQSFRGVDLKRGVMSRVKSVRAILVPLIISAIHKSEQLAITVEVRGLRARFGHSLSVDKMRATDYVLIIAAVFVIVVIFTLPTP